MRRIADEQGRGITLSQDYAAQIGWDEQEWQSTVSDGGSFATRKMPQRGGVVAVEVLRCSSGLRGYADGGAVSCDAFTFSVRSTFTPVGPTTSAINAPITINMQGSSRDPAADRQAAEMTTKAVEEPMRHVALATIQSSMSTNGNLWKAGVIRAR